MAQNIESGEGILMSKQTTLLYDTVLNNAIINA